MLSSAAIDFRRRVSPRAMAELMDGDCSYADFRGCLRSLEQVNRWLLGYRPTLCWLQHLPAELPQPLRILDVGSGGGGLLRALAGWFSRRGLRVELTGIDLNPFAARAAKEATPEELGIHWITGDALQYQPGNPVDVVVSSLTTHHLEDLEIVELLRWLESTARVGWFLNDLERSQRSAKAFALLARAAGWHRFVQHDGPVSFQRAFREEDWTRLLAEAQVPQALVTLEHWKPGRLCVGRWK